MFCIWLVVFVAIRFRACGAGNVGGPAGSVRGSGGKGFRSSLLLGAGARRDSVRKGRGAVGRHQRPNASARIGRPGASSSISFTIC
jgi:hypothetical protein